MVTLELCALAACSALLNGCGCLRWISSCSSGSGRLVLVVTVSSSLVTANKRNHCCGRRSHRLLVLISHLLISHLLAVSIIVSIIVSITATSCGSGASATALALPRTHVKVPSVVAAATLEPKALDEEFDQRCLSKGGMSELSQIHWWQLLFRVDPVDDALSQCVHRRNY